MRLHASILVVVMLVFTGSSTAARPKPRIVPGLTVKVCLRTKCTAVKLEQKELESWTREGGVTVTSVPKGISCPPRCTATFGPGEPVTLIAPPTGPTVHSDTYDYQYTFEKWVDACAKKSPCKIVVPATGKTQVTATFGKMIKPPPHQGSGYPGLGP